MDNITDKPFFAQSRFHIIYTFKYFKYFLILSAVSFIRAIINFTSGSFFIAFLTSALLFVTCFIGAFILWRNTSFTVCGEYVTINRGIFAKSNSTYCKNTIAVLDIERNLFYRLLGAAVLTIHFKNNFLPRKITFILPKKTAIAAANSLMPVREKGAVFQPVGTEKAALVLLSANVLSTGAFIYVAFDYISDFLGTSGYELALIARDNIVNISTVFQSIIPAGLSLILSFVFLIASLTVLLSFFRTAGLKVCRTGGVILCRGGLLTKTERRIKTNCILACDVKITPTARLLKRKALYITAGSYKSSDYPILVFGKHQENKPNIILPEFSLPSEKLCDYKQKSLFQYLYKPFICTAFCALLFYVLITTQINIAVFVFVLILISLVGVAVSIEGYFKEGVCKNENRTISLYYTKFLTRHETCVFTHNVKYTVWQHFFNKRKGIANLRIDMPYGYNLRARGVNEKHAMRLPFFI